MKRRMKPKGLLFTLLLSSCLFANITSAQLPARSGPLYRADREITISGRVVAVVTRPSSRSLPGEHLTLQTPKGKVDVQLGPARARIAEEHMLREGDQVEVTGAMISRRGQNVLLARQLKRGTQVLTLRNRRGFPISARGRGARSAAPRTQ